MRTYPEMDKEIVKLLDMEGMLLSVYAARVIENLQAENAELREKLDKAERRAEVIELALALAAENHRCEGCPSKECDGSIRGTQKCRDTIALLYIVQAEREIEEEKGE